MAGHKVGARRRQGVVNVLAVGLVLLTASAVAGCVADAAPVMSGAVAHNASVTVTWSEPPAKSGAGVVSYVVTPYIDGVAQTPVRFDSRATTQTLTGLVNGVSYRFDVYGLNALGSDTARSALSDPVVPAAPVEPLDAGDTLAAGSQHTCAIVDDGHVKCWGSDNSGQLGDPSTSDTNTVPVLVEGITGAVAITAGQFHTCVVLEDGTARCWGSNSWGQLGTGTNRSSQVPVPVIGLSGAVAITAGAVHTCALLGDGTARCWGDNGDGQLGDGTTSDSTTPKAISGLGAVVSISAGYQHTCAVRADRTAACWGRNGSGQLGNGTNASASTPVPVTSLTDVRAISAGGAHTCAVRAAGTVACWGVNNGSQLGTGDDEDTAVPADVVGLAGAVDLSASGGHTCALLAAGAARCWGDNDHGALGTGFAGGRATSPVAVNSLDEAVAVETGQSHTCAVLRDDRVTCWGHNEHGQLGNDDTTVEVSSTPFTATGLTGVTAVATGHSHTCALLGDGRARCWGANSHGEFGNGTTTHAENPVQVSGLTDAVALVAGSSHTCALLEDSTVRCWGYNGSGQLGDGTTTSRTTPTMVAGLDQVVAVATGGIHSCALRSGGTVACWGWNQYGQVGDGTTVDASTPQTVPGIDDAVAITAGILHSCALLETGTVKCWGDNSDGTLGTGTSAQFSTAPVEIVGLTGATAIAAGGAHTCAVLEDRTLRCWGQNGSGQLGDGTDNDSATPVAVPGLTGTISLTAGEGHTCAVLDERTAYCWGNNDFLQLGDAGGPFENPNPVPVTGITNAMAIASSWLHTCAVVADGTVRCWGNNRYGQLGGGHSGLHPTPTPVQAL